MSDARRDYAILISLAMREEAEVMASALRAEGIDAFVGNAHHANNDWWASLALGGLQVFVPRSRLAAARHAVRDRMAEADVLAIDEQSPRRDRWKAWILVVWYILPLWIVISFWFAGIITHAWSGSDSEIILGNPYSDVYRSSPY